MHASTHALQHSAHLFQLPGRLLKLEGGLVQTVGFVDEQLNALTALQHLRK